MATATVISVSIPLSSMHIAHELVCSLMINSQLPFLHSGTTLSDSLSSSSSRPTAIVESSLVPTIEVIHHTTPKISPLSGVSRTGGVDQDYIVIPTSSGTNPGGDEEDNGNRTTLKFTNGNGGMCVVEHLPSCMST